MFQLYSILLSAVCKCCVIPPVIDCVSSVTTEVYNYYILLFPISLTLVLSVKSILINDI